MECGVQMGTEKVTGGGRGTQQVRTGRRVFGWTLGALGYSNSGLPEQRTLS
jgi:hypothetical protein